MGKSSSAKVQRRVLVTAMKEQMLAEQSARPEIAAERAAALADRELVARHYADVPGQEKRLQDAGWRCAMPGKVGLGGWGNPAGVLKMIHSLMREQDGSMWAHTSFSRYGDGSLPAWHELRDAHWLLYPDLFAVQVVAPPSRHVNIGEVAHLWTRLDSPAVPDFGRYGTI